MAVDPAAAPNENGPKKTRKKPGAAVGFTCRVQNCFRDRKKCPSLSFHAFPNGNSKEKKDLRKRQIHLIDRKDFKPARVTGYFRSIS